jgi:hypothetical protein
MRAGITFTIFCYTSQRINYKHELTSHVVTNSKEETPTLSQMSKKFPLHSMDLELMAVFTTG